MKGVDFESLWRALPKSKGQAAVTVAIAEKMGLPQAVTRRALHRLEQHQLAHKQQIGVNTHWWQTGAVKRLRALQSASSRRSSTRADLLTLWHKLPESGISPRDLSIALEWRQQRVRYLLAVLAKRGNALMTKELVGVRRCNEVWRPGPEPDLNAPVKHEPDPDPVRFQSVFAWAQGISADCPL